MDTSCRLWKQIEAENYTLLLFPLVCDDKHSWTVVAELCKKNWRWFTPAFSKHFIPQEVFTAYSCAWCSGKNVIAEQRRLQGEHDHCFGHDVMHHEHGSYNHSTAKVTCETLKKNWLWSIPSRTSKKVMSADLLLRSSASQRHRCSHPHRLSQLSETLWKWFWDAFSFRSESTSIVL